MLFGLALIRFRVHKALDLVKNYLPNCVDVTSNKLIHLRDNFLESINFNYVNNYPKVQFDLSEQLVGSEELSS